MASLFPEIEVFTTGDVEITHRRIWSLKWIKNTQLKFARNLKVLDLTGLRYSSSYRPDDNKNRFINASTAVIDKLEADGVVHIGLVSFRFGATPIQVVEEYTEKREEMTKECFLTAECVAKILSIVTVDHIVFSNSGYLEQVYAICAQIDAIHIQSPIQIYFPNRKYACIWNTADPCRPLQLKFYRGSSWSGLSPRESDRIYDRFCLNLRLKSRKTESYDSEPQSFRHAIQPAEEEYVDMYKMLTVYLHLYNHPHNISSRASRGLSLEDFPNIEVNAFDGGPGDWSVRKICCDLGQTSAYEWPRQVKWQPTYEVTIAGDAKSACFDSRVDLHNHRISLADKVNPYSMLNLSESLKKISAEIGPPHSCVTVAVLDTGILACHKEFLNKIVAMKNFVPNEANDLCYDYNSHGTGCAGILLRTAPFVRLVICKVMSSQGQGQLKWAADAINWLLNDEAGPKNYCPIDIISMSFGCTSFDSNLRLAVSEAVGRGKVVVAAASNDGRKKLTNIAFPARFGDVICVGSCNNLGQPSSFTPTGREIDFLAPGENIPAPSSSHMYSDDQRRSGTSEATPMVAGIAAMVISYAETVGGRPVRTTVCHTAVMREILRKMASMPGHHDEHMGYGNLDPWRLFKYGPDHFRQVVEEIVGPLPAEAQSHQPANTRRRTRRASDSEVHMKKGGEPQ